MSKCMLGAKCSILITAIGGYCLWVIVLSLFTQAHTVYIGNTA